jgi:tetratricopeptide (TPR) repeat protein
MARKKRQRAPRRRQSRRAHTAGGSAYEFISYEVTTEPLYELPENKLPPELAAEIERLYQLVNSRPLDAIAELERLCECYPDCPKLLNFLGGAYLGIGEHETAEHIARYAYLRFPKYLFARLNYADRCVTNGRLDEFAAVLEGKYELTQLCPGRRRFHQTEAVAFFGSVGYYFGIQGDFERAKPYHDILRSLDPKGPMTKRLNKIMLLASLSDSFARMTRRFSRKPSRSTADTGAV